LRDRPIVSFAGVWRPADGGAVFAFLTTDPNPLVAPIHPKAMPVLLDEDDEERWLTCSFDDAVALAKPFPSQLMTARQDASIDAVGGGARPLFS
jgi:putative SOS response-associated peptidase YedK